MIIKIRTMSNRVVEGFKIKRYGIQGKYETNVLEE